jgi:hypothetical protein
VDESPEDVNAFNAPDPVRAGALYVDRWDWHVKVDAAVRAGGVVVPDVVGQDPFEVAAVPDQDPVQAFGAYRSDPCTARIFDHGP